MGHLRLSNGSLRGFFVFFFCGVMCIKLINCIKSAVEPELQGVNTVRCLCNNLTTTSTSKGNRNDFLPGQKRFSYDNS